MGGNAKREWLRVLVIIGGIITFGFGIWHFTVPWLYGWFDYLASIPEELINGIIATNLFLSVCLILLGTLATLVGVVRWYHLRLGRLIAWAMSLLWIIRVGYQIVKPQGTMIPGLSVVMLVVFVVTALCFLIPAFALTRPHR